MSTQVPWAEVLLEAIRHASVSLPSDIVAGLQRALGAETSDLARLHLETILENERVARENGLPLCQDTGTPVFFVRAGVESSWLAAVEPSLLDVVRRATDSIPLRPSAIDPFAGRNVGNVGRGVPVIDWDLVPGAEITITYVAKGGGSENASALLLVPPDGGEPGVLRAVLAHVVRVAPRACPPVIIGVGIGGTTDLALRLAKRALIRPLGAHHADPAVAAFEDRLLDAVNRSGIGPMGLGGSCTALAVHADFACRHPASLPVGVALQCWADRRITVRIAADGAAEVVE
ncbi:MAG: fumarate hydratase [Candidatus Bipolaricaulota bacterium]|nr:fumarate hydratase [Candidatus Bipolaricaulota bacterium]